MDEFKKFLGKVVSKIDLEEEEAFQAFSLLAHDDLVSPPMAAAFLTALAVKGESVGELVGGAKAMLRRARAFPRPAGLVADIVGTGGDGKGTCNISTLAALAAAACGVPVAKHGNRASSGRSGSADLAEALGIPLALDPAESAARLQSLNFAYLFAPYYHESFKRIAEVRRALGFRTIFNRLGPLVNPARPSVVLLGVARADWLFPTAQAMLLLGFEKGWVVHGAGGSDELDLAAENQVAKFDGNGIAMFPLSPEEAGLKRAGLEMLAGEGQKESTRKAAGVLRGEESALLDAVALNAGALLFLAGAARDIREGTKLALERLKKGEASSLVEKLAKHGTYAS